MPNKYKKGKDSYIYNNYFVLDALYMVTVP